MWTGNWWLKIQKLLPYGATLVPLIFSSNKTTLMNAPGDKKAWPVYLTIGNIPKATRRHVSSRATVLVGYLPVSKYKCCTAGDARQQAEHWLFHTWFKKILGSLGNEGREGVEVKCSDGWVRRCFPILGAYVADHPEQCLIACCKQNTCWACKVPVDECGENKTWEARTQRETGAEIVAQALGINTTSFGQNGYKPVGCAPFWYSLPHCDIFSSFPPDLLHQTHKGLFKDHVFQWCREIVDDDEVLDERFVVLPSHGSVLSFAQGVTSLSQTTGRQHKAMEKSIASVINGLVLDKVVQAFHSLSHYADSIASLGSVDGYNTEHLERLHIDMAKHAYQASNKREYTAQMTNWRYRLDAVLTRDTFIRWTQSLIDIPSHPSSAQKCTFTSNGTTVTLPKNPSFAAATFSTLETQFKATGFMLALCTFLDKEQPDLAAQITGHERFNVFVEADVAIDPAFDPYAHDLEDCLHASPCKPGNPEELSGRFNTVLVRKHPENGLEFGMSSE
ncbi:hypothetical protein BDV93DRAFT_565982 [Ceratobasidium sp. AG-I]|nr:hypothetical protein BDV93DRAFT_565982 [Ceratobasidium sp. AG-I]